MARSSVYESTFETQRDDLATSFLVAQRPRTSLRDSFDFRLRLYVLVFKLITYISFLSSPGFWHIE